MENKTEENLPNNMSFQQLINEEDPPHIKSLIELLHSIAMDSAPRDFFMFPKRFNSCLVGHTHHGNPIYSYSSMLSIYCTEDKMSVEEAVDFMDFNVLGMCYKKDAIHPIVMYVNLAE